MKKTGEKNLSHPHTSWRVLQLIYASAGKVRQKLIRHNYDYPWIQVLCICSFTNNIDVILDAETSH